MENLMNNLTAFLILVFIMITFLQSGLDKLFDWKGNISWLTSHFGKTFLRGTVPLLVGVIMVLEILTGILAVAGIYNLLVNNDSDLALAATVLAAISLLMLLFGQRIAKDYAGAFTITGYFIVVLIGVYILNT